MAKATEKRRVGYVTIATVRSRDEARRIASKLEPAGIASLLAMEPDPATRWPMGLRFGGIKVQVLRPDARRAVQLLRQKEDEPGKHDSDFPAVKRWHRLRIAGWKRTAVELLGIIAVAGLLAAWWF